MTTTVRNIKAIMLKDGTVYSLESAAMHCEVAEHYKVTNKELNHVGYMVDGEFSISPMYLVRPQGDKKCQVQQFNLDPQLVMTLRL